MTYMKKIIYFIVAAAMLMACNKDTEWTSYEGDYRVDANTEIILNGETVMISDYENAEIGITLTDGNNCIIVLRNFINGQPEVSIPGTLDQAGSKSASGASFSGSANTTDRTVTVEGITAESTIASISINEKITVEGIPGTWTVGNAAISFSHPDLNVIDLSGISEGLTVNVQDIVAAANEAIGQAIADGGFEGSCIIFTEDGYVTERQVGYYVRPDEKTLYIYLSKSTVETLFGEIKEDPDAMDIIGMLGFSSFIENPQSMNIALQYATGENSLSLTATQALLDPYRDMLAQPVAIIKAFISQMTYSMFTEMFYGLPQITEIITEDKFPAFKEIILDTFDTVTDGRAQYSVRLDLVPFNA